MSTDIFDFKQPQFHCYCEGCSIAVGRLLKEVSRL